MMLPRIANIFLLFRVWRERRRAGFWAFYGLLVASPFTEPTDRRTLTHCLVSILSLFGCGWLGHIRILSLAARCHLSWGGIVLTLIFTAGACLTRVRTARTTTWCTTPTTLTRAWTAAWLWGLWSLLQIDQMFLFKLMHLSIMSRFKWCIMIVITAQNGLRHFFKCIWLICIYFFRIHSKQTCQVFCFVRVGCGAQEMPLLLMIMHLIWIADEVGPVCADLSCKQRKRCKLGHIQIWFVL